MASAKNCMIVFWSRYGATERVALAAAVGAVQGRANIRLRWLKEDSCDASDQEWVENRARMEAEYIQPRPIDLEWAEYVVLASPDRVGGGSVEWQSFLRSVSGKKVLRIGLGDVLLESAVSCEVSEAGPSARRLVGG